LFYNAAGTFYLEKHLEPYLKHSKSTQDFIYTWMRNDVILASCRVLGIIGELLNEPYWTFSADDSKCAIDMGNIYNRLVTFLKICIENPKLPLENKVSLSFGPSTVLDDVSKHLFLSSNRDEKTEL
jgi:hypothetical protein